MAKEWTKFDRKSLRLVTGKTADFTELAADCVAFATAFGGIIHIGIEDGADSPPAHQRVDPQFPDKIRRRIGELTVNVDTHAAIKTDTNGGEYIELTIPRSTPLPSTVDGRYLIRTTDGRKPVTGDDVLRLAGERASFSWETSTSLGIPADNVDGAKRPLSRKLSGTPTASNNRSKRKQTRKSWNTMRLPGTSFSPISASSVSAPRLIAISSEPPPSSRLSNMTSTSRK